MMPNASDGIYTSSGKCPLNISTGKSLAILRRMRMQVHRVVGV
jgi:hypothetical protein